MKIYFPTLILCFSIIQSIYSQNPDQVKSPYKSTWSVDGPIFGTAFVVAFTASAIDAKIMNLTLTDINSLSKNDINSIDRLTAGFYSKDQSIISDVLVGSSIVSPFLLMFDNNIRQDAGTIATMYFETVLFATFTPSYGKGGVKRIRPYVYGTKAPLSDKLDNDSRRSFFSGHATWAFATSVFFANIYSDYYPDSEYNNYVWYGSIGLASTVSILRVTSGAHFISDVIVGAAVGSTIGYVIPYLHRNHSDDYSLLPQLSPHYRGLALTVYLK